MFFVYVLRSTKNGKRYVGYTSKTPEERLRGHNKGDNVWTRNNKPFVLMHREQYVTKTEAIRREKFLKSGDGRQFLDNLFPR